ncbi:SMI1/KNR4 family protein [Viridibacillus sp. YIM B01967]|uniref:SMI1/KNR4 family protein n=1 Tax=Viridibacillus soli TaxID=2798301 RepID=A0ABS1H6C4_9BACL|nr:SMI1/KNR4 family protein [Viridibacillus soli]MBK3494940.1 SMI1/KNR4 family protein [Viridibacillus soli]
MRNIWELSEDNYYKLEGLEESDIEFAEKFFSIKLPKEYTELLKIQNGGSLIYNSLPVSFKNSWADDHVPLNFLYGVKKVKGIIEFTEALKEWGINEKKLITISGDGHYWIVLDYRKSTMEPRITFIDSENRLIKTIFNSFKEMVNNLYTHDYNDIDLVGPYQYELSVSNAKKLIHSENKDEISHGISIWVSSYEEFDQLVLILINFIENHEDKDIMYQSAQELTSLIINEFIVGEDIINKLLIAINNRGDKDLDLFKVQILEFKNK